MKSGKRITLKDIAKACDLSVSGVSMALREHASIPKETVARVKKAARELGYQPDPALAALGAYRQSNHKPVKSVIAYVDTRDRKKLPTSIVEHSQYFEGAQKQAQALGYHLELFWMLDHGKDEKGLNRVLQTRGIRGMLIAPFMQPEGELNLDWPEFTAVALGRTMAKPKLNCVSHDHATSVITLMEKLKSYGYKRPGLVLDPLMNKRVNYRWLAGYLLAQHLHFPNQEALPPFLESPTHEVAFITWLNKQACDSLVSIHGELPEICKKHGIRIPEDIGFVDLDCTYSATSGIAQDMKRVGSVAVNLLHQNLLANNRGIPEDPQLVLLRGEWQEGNTLEAKS